MSFPSQREQGKGQASGDRGHPRDLSLIAPRLESRAMLRVEDEPPEEVAEPPEEGAGSGPAVGRWTMSVRPKALPVPSLPLKFPAFHFRHLLASERRWESHKNSEERQEQRTEWAEQGRQKGPARTLGSPGMHGRLKDSFKV